MCTGTQLSTSALGNIVVRRQAFASRKKDTSYIHYHIVGPTFVLFVDCKILSPLNDEQHETLGRDKIL